MKAILTRYYQAFNAGNYAGMLELLTDDVLHEPSQGVPRPGKDKFREFLAHMERCYKEEVINPVFMANEDGTRGAAEFMLKGTYLQTDSDLPAAHGQTYELRVGTFFEFRDGKISRVSNHYNLQSWLDQIGA
jgi:steroid delta-isomerase-like uncharacterized protein